jgi:hypothetical protein
MRTQRSCLVAMITVVCALALHSPSALAEGASNGDRHGRSVVVTFTKWVTAVVPPVPADAVASRFLMAGVVGGEIGGTFVGEVIDRRVSTTGTVTTQIVALDALYEIEAGDHSFTALVHGGQNNGTHKAILDGIILDGWRTGAAVHVNYDVISGCAGKPAGPCFQGTIRVSAADDEN